MRNKPKGGDRAPQGERRKGARLFRRTQEPRGLQREAEGERRRREVLLAVATSPRSSPSKPPSTSPRSESASWPVSRVLYGRRLPPRDGHSSGTSVAGRLTQPTRAAGAGNSAGAFRSAPPLFGLAPGGVYHAGPVAGPRWALTPPFHPCRAGAERRGRRFAFCGTFPGVAPAGRYPAPCLHGARTFLPGSLSAFAGAAVRPAGGLDMGLRRTRGQPRIGSAAIGGRALRPSNVGEPVDQLRPEMALEGGDDRLESRRRIRPVPARP